MLLVATSFAGESCRLNYWGDEGECPRRTSAPNVAPAVTNEASSTPPSPKKSSIRELDEEPFDWAAYQDPTDVRFWDDGGDWVPSRPLRETLANPTPENVARYRRWTEQKLELAQMGQQAIWGAAPTRQVVDTARSEVVSESQPRVSWDGIRVVYFYQSGCPHCRASIPLVQDLRKRGVEVLPVYLDRPEPELGESSPYTAEMRASLPVEGTPTWLVDNGVHQTVVRGRTTLGRLARVVQLLDAEEGR